MKRNVFAIVFLVVVLFAAASKATEMTLEKLTELTQSGKEEPVTGRIVFTKSRIDHYSPKGKQPIPGRENVFVYNKDRISGNTIIFDNKRGSTRIDEVDLAKKESMAPSDAAYSDISNTHISQGNALLNYFPSAKSIMMDINRNDTEGSYALKHYRYGYAAPRWLALDGAKKVEISEVSEDGKNLIAVYSEKQENGKLHTRTIKIEPKIGYRLVSFNEYSDGELSHEIKYENYKNFGGYYLPKRYHNKRYTNGRVAKEIEIIINDAKFGIKVDDKVFTVKVPEGTMVAGRSPLFPRTLLKSWRTEQSEQLTIDSIVNREMDDLVSKEIEKMAPPEEQTKEHLFLPNINHTLKQEKLFILDLASRRLVSVFPLENKIDSQRIHDHLVKAGKGDIAWDGALVTVRKAKALTTRQESNQPLQLTSGKWVDSYKLPEKVELPYSTMVVTDRNLNYLITIHKIESDGIRITYRKLSASEAKHCLPAK